MGEASMTPARARAALDAEARRTRRGSDLQRTADPRRHDDGRVTPDDAADDAPGLWSWVVTAGPRREASPPGLPGALGSVAALAARLWEALRGRLPMLSPALLTAPRDHWTAARLARRLRLGRVAGVERTTADLLVVRTEPAGGAGAASAPGAVQHALKHPLSDRARAALRCETEVLALLSADARIGTRWQALLPVSRVHREGVAQAWLPGVPASAWTAADPGAARRAGAHALAAMEELHRRTGRHCPAGPYTASWVEPAVEVLRREVPACRTPAGAAALALLRGRLEDGLRAAGELRVGWTHGDFHPGNVLLDPGGGEVTGVIDWVQSQREGPTEVDPRMYAFALRHRLSGREFGLCVVDALRAGGLTPEDRALLRGSGDADAGAGAGRSALDPAAEYALTLLTWLWHVAGNAAKSRRFGRSHRWTARNVLPVLRELTQSQTPSAPSRPTGSPAAA